MLIYRTSLKVFDIHARLIGEDTYDFYRISNNHFYNERSDREDYEWKEEVFLISDLFFEFTSLANLLLRKIRELQPNFLAEYGILSIIEARDCNNQRSSIEYRQNEVTDSPYPGLIEFLSLRESRLFHYGEGDGIKDALKRELVLN